MPRAVRPSTPAPLCLLASSSKSVECRAPAAPTLPLRQSHTTSLAAAFSLQFLRCAARFGITQRACGEELSPPIPGLDAPPLVGIALDGHESGLVGRDDTPDQRARPGCRARRQFA